MSAGTNLSFSRGHGKNQLRSYQVVLRMVALGLQFSVAFMAKHVQVARKSDGSR